MLTVVPAEGRVLETVLDATWPDFHRGLSRKAFATLDAATRKTTWALAHQRRFALLDGAELLASAQRSDLTATLREQRLRVCGIGAVWPNPLDEHSRELVGRLIDEARLNRADVAIVFASSDEAMAVSGDFEIIPTTDVELSVTESPRYGAPMTMVRGGEDRDLEAIVAMGRTRATPYRFHLERDVDLVKHVITKKRLLAGLGATGVRQLYFMIAEEGITAAAYVVITSVDGTWTIEECGDRDPSGARAGALLQALIAREPAERRPIIRAWLPGGFAPPQVTIVSTRPATEVMLGRGLTTTGTRLCLAGEDVLYWRSDVL